MADIRLRSKRIKDEKTHKRRVSELKRYLDSFPSEKRGDAQRVMTLIHQTKSQESRYSYLSFFSIAIAIGVLSLGYWGEPAGKATVVAALAVFCAMAYKVVVCAYKVEQLKRILGSLGNKD